MKSKQIRLIIFTITLIVVFLINGIAENIIPKKPSNVLKEAKWESILSLWSFGDRLEGNKTLWYKDGTYLYREILVKSNFKKSIRYHENGKIQRVGQLQYFKDKYCDNDGNLIGWIEIGKWKEYDKEGSLIHEWCLTPNPNRGGEEPQKCGEENFYNKDGSLKEKNNHKLECKYGCEELEYKDSTK